MEMSCHKQEISRVSPDTADRRTPKQRSETLTQIV